MAGNVFLEGAKPSKHETAPLVKPEFDSRLKLLEEADGLYPDSLQGDWLWSARLPVLRGLARNLGHGLEASGRMESRAENRKTRSAT